MHEPHPFRQAVEAGDHAAATALLHDEVEFRSPAVHRPYHGRDAVGFILEHAAATFSDFRYVDELTVDDRTALFFRAGVGDRDLEGVDYLICDPQGRITSLTVMIRPLSGLTALAEAMGKRLETQT